MAEQSDLIIVGGGAAGLTAALFAARYGLKTLLLERTIPGGQIVNAETVENFPGLAGGVSGPDLAAQLQEQAMNSGAEVRLAEATALRVVPPLLMMDTGEGTFAAKAVVLAGGSSLRSLGIPGEAELTGKGVSHCATCDGPMFAGETVVVVGGGDSALDEALTLAQYAKKVVLIHRRDSLRGQRVLQGRVLSSPRIEVCWNTEVTAVLGEEQVRALSLRHLPDGAATQLPVTGVFIYVGLEPNTAWLRGVLPLDNAGHIPVDPWMQTPLPGVFAAGDIRQGSAAQLVSAAGDGATAAIAAHRYITARFL
ncbi:MAG: FAD-dependent oxidoreductase [Chloroflexi bacterium]|nr:FAD-dependent oxidoreductase [Chloroflexota bacterium]